MPGVNLNLPIPSLSDTQTIVITKIATALTAIQNDLTPNVVPSEITINSTLQFAGNGLSNVGTLGFATTIPQLIAGNMFYTGELFIVTAAGLVQLTNNGQINLAGGGGIVGDYTATSAAVSYDNANGRYRFFGSGGTSLVDIDTKNLIANNTTTGKVIIGVDASLVTTKTINIKSLPTSGAGLLVYNSATSTIEDAALTLITGGVTLNGAVVLNGTTTINSVIKHSTWAAEVPWQVGLNNNIGGSIAANANGELAATGPNWAWNSLLVTAIGMQTGETVTTVVARVNRPSAGTFGLILRKKTLGGAPVNVQSTSTTTVGTSDVTLTIAAPTPILARERWWIEMGDTVSSTVQALNLTWTG